MFEFIFNNHVLHWWIEKCVYIWHWYCLNCICTEVLFSHLKCKFFKGITNSISLWSRIVPSTLGFLQSVPLNYIWLEGFHIQPSGHQRMTVVSGRGAVEGARPRSIAAETSHGPASSPRQALYPNPTVYCSPWWAISTGIQRFTRKVKESKKKSSYRKTKWQTYFNDWHNQHSRKCMRWK